MTISLAGWRQLSCPVQPGYNLIKKPLYFGGVLCQASPSNQHRSSYSWKNVKKDATQESAAARCGFSERSGRHIDKRELQPCGKKKRYWRTRPDYFTEVWESEVVPLLRKESELAPKTLFERLQKDHPSEYPDSKLRTFRNFSKSIGKIIFNFGKAFCENL